MSLTTARQLGLPEIGAFALVDLVPGADASALDQYTEGGGEVVTPFEETRVKNLEEVGDVPIVLAAFLALLGLSALLHSLVRAIQAGRHDLAVLTTLGLRRRDLRSLTAWQSVTTVLVGGTLGILLGVVVGRLTWSASARSAGVVEDVVVPVALLAAVGVGVVLAALLLAEVSSRILVRRSTAQALRVD
jgi:predicted lysophospholipase L1 biosynthesis ABC-type transport system permease subunit